MGGSSWQRMLTGIALGLSVLPGTPVAADLRQGLDECAAIEDDGKRLACFDALASASNEPYSAAGMQPSDTADESPATMVTDTAATSTVTSEPAQSPPIIAPAPASDAEKDKKVFSVRLTRCTETSVSGRQVYYLDNGEVWRQSNSSRNNVRNCDTPVTIEKDLFGFKMHVPSEDRSIRITPVR